jgi:pSer/pThr/pTyr-binding forkhead associated (FHA) protein
MAVVTLLAILIGLLAVLALVPVPGSRRPMSIQPESSGTKGLSPMRSHARILLHSMDGTTKSFYLRGERISLGRSSANDLSYPESTGLSRQHLVFEKDGDDWAVIDVGSKNGTLVNGVRISAKHVLRAGDRILAGPLKLAYDHSFHSTSKLSRRFC